MTTLCLDLALEKTSRLDLHEWLGGNWALLFSNPEDFQPRAKGKDRFLGELRREFDARALRAITIKRDGLPEGSWLDELHFDRELIRLREPAFAAADAISFAARALRGELLTLQSRFVLIIDGALKRRELLKYSAGRHSASVLDLLASVDALRSRKLMSRAA
jgi:alkyl hydroperoxide reductase subunit AhpC